MKRSEINMHLIQKEKKNINGQDFDTIFHDPEYEFLEDVDRPYCHHSLHLHWFDHEEFDPRYLVWLPYV